MRIGDGMLSSAGMWRIPPDDLDAIRHDGVIGQRIRVMGNAGGESVFAEGWIIGWLNAAGFACPRDEAVAVKLQVYRTDASRITGRSILVPLGPPPTHMFA